MPRLKFVLPPAIAVIAVIAVVVSASAAEPAPEWFKGGSPLSESTSIAFTGKSIAGTPTLESTSGNKVLCESSSSKGEISGPRAIKNTLVTYHGCKEGTRVCTSSKQTSGTVQTFKLIGENVYLDTGHTKAGVVLKAASGTKFATFKCGESEIQVTGAVIPVATPLNEGDRTTGELSFAQEKGRQQWQKIEEAGETKYIVAFLLEAGIGGGATFSSPLTEEDTFASAVELHS
jgi:hypothetical protein